MAPSRTHRSLPLVLCTLVALTPFACASYECKDIIAKGVHFNLEKLGGPYVVRWSTDDMDNEARYNYNFTLDICNVLKKHKGAKKEDSCSQGTRVCAIKEYVDLSGRNNATITPIDIAGTYALGGNGKPLDPKFELLGNTGSVEDDGREGVRVELHGGQHELKEIKKKENQRAIIEFVCDKERTGLEGDKRDNGDFESEDSKRIPNDEVEKEGERLRRGVSKRNGKCVDSDASLRFCGYELEEPGKDTEVKTLRLEWRTKHACANVSTDPVEPHWGFFTWFIIIFFLATATYLIFGSWLNYNRYGARGWDLLPHGDTIRDIPYVLKDVARNVVNSVQGSGSRGGYSAV